MNLPSFFRTYESVTPGILSLLSETTLGTNGARYRHLDTEIRIHEADNPLFLTIERHGKVLGNITFCRRGSVWYIRYFAFRSSLQGSGDDKRSSGQSFIKQALRKYFDDLIQSGQVMAFYAYIDPQNIRSKWMSELFGFEVSGKVVTQTYSRIIPKKSNRLVLLNRWEDIREIVNDSYSDYQYFTTYHVAQPPFWALVENNEILAFGKFTHVQWEIERLPGSLGKVLVRIIPFTPLINKLINPNKHSFLVPDILYAQNRDATLLDELFQAVLQREKKNVIMWWVDEKDRLFQDVQKNMSWGLLHWILGSPSVDIVSRLNRKFQSEKKAPIFINAFDFI
jgi:RimJ/RimL family protein N-acetyltransferase